MKTTIIKIVFLIGIGTGLPGCSSLWQNVKDNYEHQFNDNREDDQSGEWFSDKAPVNDSAQYTIILTYELKDGRIATKQLILFDTASAVFNIKEEDVKSPMPVSVACYWKHAKIYHKMFIRIGNWAYNINFGTGENGDVKIEDNIRRTKDGNYKIEAGITANQ